jgi:hypothetical protein
LCSYEWYSARCGCWRRRGRRVAGARGMLRVRDMTIVDCSVLQRRSDVMRDLLQTNKTNKCSTACFLVICYDTIWRRGYLASRTSACCPQFNLTSLHPVPHFTFVDSNSTSIFTHLYDTERVRVFFEMVTEEAFVTKKTSKLIEQTIGIRLAMETIRANNLALSNKWPRQHALPCQQPQHLFSFQDMRRFILSFLTSTQSIYTLTQ